MGVALFTSGPYIEMTIARGTIMTPTIEKNDKGEDVVTWRVPLTEEGAVVHVSLDDCGYYVPWLFDNADRANGLDLQVAIDHTRYADLAAAFAKITMHSAQFVPVSFETYWNESPLGPRAEFPAGYFAEVNDPATMTVKDNFTDFWNVWRHSGPDRNDGLIRRDYALLDKTHPSRIALAEEYFRREDRRGRNAGFGSLWDRV